MDFDRDKVDEVALALLWLTHFRDGGGVRAWKGHDFGTMDRLYERDYISNPKGKAKSVALTEEGEAFQGTIREVLQTENIDPESQDAHHRQFLAEGSESPTIHSETRKASC